ncbi:unnamed protein product [Pieris macdunnoughi]|uniref:Choline O-acetyltransferase n=1 Tax=Pieris macdunnoughi TaxID=345717 RepID=A0A821QBG3_9NEOP|nr:unnamed protein product [Pieris macdunnoughi]
MSTPTQVYLINEHKFILPTSSNDLQHNNQTYVPASLQFRGSNDLSSRNVPPSTQNNLGARFNETTLKMYMQGKYQTNFKDLSRQPAYDVTKNDLTSRKSLRGNYDTYRTPNSQTNKNNYIKSPNISTSTQSIFKNSLGPVNIDNFQYNEDIISLKNVNNDFTLSTISQYNISNGQRLVTTTSDENIQENNSELNYISNQSFSSTKSSSNQNTTTFQQLPSTQNNLRALNETTLKIYIQEKYQTNLKDISKDFSSQPAYGVTKKYLTGRQSLKLASFNDSFRGNYGTYKTANSQPNKYYHKKGLNTSTQSMFQNSQRAAIRDNFKYNEDISLKTVKNYLSPSTITHYNISNGQSLDTTASEKNVQDKSTVQDNLRIQEILITTTPIQSSQQRLITTIKGSKKKSTQDNCTAINNFIGQQILTLATPYNKFKEKVTVPETHYHPSLTTPVIQDNFQENNQKTFKGEKTHAHATHHQPTQSYFSKGHNFSSTTFRYNNILLQMNGENNNDFTTSTPSTYKGNKSFPLRKTQQLTGLTIKNNDNNKSDLLWKNKIPNLPPDSTYDMTTSSNDLQYSHQTYVPVNLQFRGSNDLSSRNVSPSTQNNLRARLNETKLKNYKQEQYQTNLKDKSKGFRRQPAYSDTKTKLKQSLKLASFNDSFRGNYDTYRQPNKNNHKNSLNIPNSSQSMFENSQSPDIRENYEYNEDNALKNVKNDKTPSTITHNNISNGQSLDTTTDKNLSDKNIQENNTELNYILNRRFISTESRNHQNTTTTVSKDEFQILNTALLYLKDQPISISETLKNIQDKSTVQDNLRIKKKLVTTTPTQSSQQSLITTIKGSKKKSTHESRTEINNFTGQQILSLASPYNTFKEKVTVQKTHYHPSLTTPVIRDNWQESNQRFKGEKTHAHTTHHQLTHSYFSKGHNFSSTTFRYDNILVQMNVENNNEFATSAPSSYKGNKKLLRKTQKSTGLTINNNAKNNSDPLWKNKIPNLPPDSTYNIYIKNPTELRKVKHTLTTPESDIIINTKKPQLLVTQFNISQQNVGKFKNVGSNYFDNTTSTSNISLKSSDIQFQEKALISTIVPSLFKTVLNKDIANRSVRKSNIAAPNNSSAYNVNLKHSSKNNQTLILQDNLQYMISNNITNKTLTIFPTDMETNIEMNVSKSKKLPLGIFNTYITSAVDYTHIEDKIIQKNLKFANNLILAKTITPNILNEYLKPTKILSNNYFKSIKEKGRIDEIKDAFTDLASNTISPLWTVTKSLNRLPKLKKATKHSSTYVTIKKYYLDNIYRSYISRLYSDAREIANYTMGYNGSNHLSSTKQTKSMIKNNIEGITKTSPRPFEYNQTDKIATHNLKSAVTDYNVNKSKSVATLRRQKDYSTTLGNIRKLENSSVKAVTSAISTPYRNNLNRTRMLNLSYTTTKIPGKLTYNMNRNSYTAITTPMAYHYENNKGPPTAKINLGNATRKIYKEIQVKDTKNIKNEIKMLIATRPLTNNVTIDDSTLSDSNMNFELHSGKQLNSSNKFVFLKIDKSTTVSDFTSKNFTIQSPTSRDWNNSSSPSVQEIDTTTLESLKSEPHQGQLNITQSVILHNRFRHGKSKNNRAITASSSNSLKQWTTLLPLTEQKIKLWSVKTLSPKLLTDVQNGLLLLNHSYSHNTTQPAQNYVEKATTSAIKSQNSEFTNVIKPSIALFTTQVSEEIQTGQNVLRGVIENDKYVIFNNTVPTTNVIDHSKFTVHQNYMKTSTEMSIFSKYRKENDVRFAKRDNYFTTDLRSKTAKYSDAIGKTKKSMNLTSENIMNTSKKILYNKNPLDITTPLLPERIINVQNTTTMLSFITKVDNGGTNEYNNSNTMNYNTDNVSLLSKQFNKKFLKFNVNPIRIYNDLIKKSIRTTSPVNIIELKVSMPTEVVATSQRKSERSEIKEIELDIDQNVTKTKDLPVQTPTETFLKTTNFINPIKQNNTTFTRQYLFNNRYTIGLDSENMNLLGTTTLKAENTKTFDDHLSILKHHFGFDNITSMQNKTLNTLLLGRYKIIRTSTTSYENKATQTFHLQNRSRSPLQNIRKEQNVTNNNKPQTKYCSDVYKAVYLQNIYLNIPILVANHNDINVCNFSYNIVDNTHSNFTTKQLNFSHIIPKNKLSDYLKNISTLISSKTIDQTYSSEKDTQNVFKEAFKFKQINPKTEIILTQTSWPMTTENKNVAYLKTNPNINLLPTERKIPNIATKKNESAIKPAKVSLDTDFTTALYSSTTKTLTTSSFVNVVKAITPPLKVKKIRYNTYKPKTEEDFDSTILKLNKKKFSTINTVQKAVTKSDYRLLSSTTYKEKITSNKKNKHLNHLKYSGAPKGPVKDMRKIIVHTKSVMDPLAKTNLYPVQRIPSTSQRKVMKRIRLHKNKELLAMDTNDFFSRRHNEVPESRGKSHGILRKGFFTPKPKEYIIRPTFKMIDKPQSFRPKPIIIESDSFYKNHFPRNRGKSLSLIEQVDYFRDTIKEPQTVLERPAYLPPHTKPKFLRDRIDSIRNYVHNSEYLRASDSAGEIDRYAVFREPEFNFRRHETTTTIRTTVTDWWLDDMYLKVRLPLPINSSPGMVFPRKHFAKIDEVADLAALYIDDLLDYKEMLDRDELPQERATSREKGQPLCMEQFYRLLGVCRVPGEGKDRLSLPIPPPDPDNCEELVIVACRNYFYAVPVKAPDRGRLSAGEIQAQLLHALVDASAAPPAPRVGLLTAMNRDDWAKAREQLLKDENNRNNLELLNRALCLVCLDESGGDRRDCDTDTNALLRAMHGAGTQHHSANRWFDKTVQLIISSDGTVGMCYEHSPAEGVAVVRLAERALERAEVADRPKPPPTLFPAPERLQWKLTPELNNTIEKAARDFDRAIKDLDLRVYTYRGYGREYMKSCRTSPDVYIQLALQYAYYKMYGHLVATYESCSLRRFRNGRVDNIRSSHSAALAWATVMCAPESPATSQTDDGQKKVSFDLQEGQKKIDLFYEAARKQTTIMEANIQGQGTDNHMLGLREAARETFGSLPPLFTDPAYQKMIEFKLSTSQVATTTDGTFMGYGAVVPDGYGCSYNPKKDHVIFCISSFVASNVTSTEAFRQSLEEALDSMKVLFDSRKNEK